MTLYVDKRGHGPVPLVLLHGWAMHGGVLAPLVDALEAHCTMYVVDLPGHGHSRDCGLPLEPQACAAAIARVTPPALWLGWSLGGLIALTAALEMPRQVRGLAMLCATPKFARDAGWPFGADGKLVHQLATDLETDYHATLERFLALEAMGSADPRAELRHLRSLVFARGEPDLRVLQEGIRILETVDRRAALPISAYLARGSAGAATGWCRRRPCTGRPAVAAAATTTSRRPATHHSSAMPRPSRDSCSRCWHPLFPSRSDE